LKAARPEIALGADLIAGFPTETEAHFENLISIVDACGLAFVHAFPFSPREGTPAARMPQVDRRVVKERAAKLREAGARALARHLDAWVGREAIALMEREGFARLPDFTGVVLPPFSLAEKGSGDEGRSDVQTSARLNAPHPPAPSPQGGGGAALRLRFTSHDGAHLIGEPA